MDLVLVTGAGASHDLGSGDDPLPLMSEWSDALYVALNEAESNLASRCRLTPGLDSESFESALGELLRWEAVKYLNSQFAELTDNPAQFRTNDQQASVRLSLARKVIDETLYAQFGQERVDDAAARKAYGDLLGKLGVERLVLATTNYDRSCEAALSVLGKHPDAGFYPNDSESLPTLDVANLVAGAWEGERTACLHLHGAVGWYQKDGIVYDFKAAHPFNETLGAPVVLYPDPEKDPTSDAHVAALWEEFRIALGLATHVLVVGHSLHDPALVKELRAAKVERMAVTYFAGGGDAEEAQRARIEQELPSAIPIAMEFGPVVKTQPGGIEAFTAESDST